MKDKLFSFLISPTSDLKRRSALAGVQKRNYPVHTDLKTIKQSLRKQRENSLSNIQDLLNQTMEKLNSIDGVDAQVADDSESAALMIKEIVKNQSDIDTNNSKTIKEIEKELESVGIKINSTYYDKEFHLTNKFQNFWEKPDLNIEPSELTFSVDQKLLMNCPPKEDDDNAFCLIGANAVSAEDGSFYFLQHSWNIGELLNRNNIIILIGLEKLALTNQDAEFQTKWAGNFGLSSILLDLDLDKNQHKDPPITSKRAKKNKSESNGRNISVIFLDNGRQNVLNSEFRDVLLCISCRSCMQHCPNYKFFGKSSGLYPQQYLFSFLTGRNPSVDLCAVCGNCAVDCPVGIDFCTLMQKAKVLKSSNLKLGDLLLANPDIVANLLKHFSFLPGTMLENKLIRQMTDTVFGISKNRKLPVAKKIPPVNQKGKKTKKVIYYPGCYATFFENNIFTSAIKLLNYFNYEVIIPTKVCCGIPLFSVGNLSKGVNKAENVIKSLSEGELSGLDIVTTCPSCSLALKHDYSAHEIENAENVSDRVIDLEAFLIPLLSDLDLKKKIKGLDLHIDYHLPCHMRVQGQDALSQKFFSMIPGVSFKNIGRGCCGMSGTFGDKTKNFDYSMETGQNVFEAIGNSDADVVCTECGPCKMQILEGTDKKVIHPIVMLADILDPDIL